MNNARFISLRRTVLRAAAAAAVLAAPFASPAQVPSTVHLLVGFPPGGGTDAIARLLAEALKAELAGTNLIVENKPGAGGQLAAQALKAAMPDGSTLFLSHDHTISILPQVVKKPGYDPRVDFEPVGGFATFVNGLAMARGTPARTVAEFVDWVRSRGGHGAVGIPAPSSTRRQ